MAKSLLELVQETKKDIESRSGNRIRPWKAQPGKNVIRILPSWRGEGDPQFFHVFGQHFVKDTSGKVKAVYICTDHTFGKPCDICDAINRGIAMTNDPALQDVLKGAQSRPVYLVNAIVANSSTKDPQICEIKPTAFNQILSVVGEYQEPEEYEDEEGNLVTPDPIDLTSLKEGRTFTIERTGAGLNTSYSATVGANPKPVSRDVLAKLHNLDDFVAQEYNAGKIKALTAVNAVAGYLPAGQGTQSAGQGTQSSAPRAAGNVMDDAANGLDDAKEPELTPEEMDDVLGDLEGLSS